MIELIYENKNVAEWSFVDESTIEFRIHNSSNVIEINFLKLEKFYPLKIGTVDQYDCFEIVALFEYKQQKYYIYIEDNKMKVVDRFSLAGEEGLPVRIDFLDNRFEASIENKVAVIRDKKSDWSYTVDERLFSMRSGVIDETMTYTGNIPGDANPYPFFRISIGDYHAFYEVYRASKQYVMKYLKLKMLSNNIPKTIKIESETFNILSLKIGNEIFKIRRDSINKTRKSFGKIKEKLQYPIYFEANGKFFSLYTIKGELFIENAKKKDDYFIKSFKPYCYRFFKKIICFGKLKYSQDVTSLDLTSVRTGSNIQLAKLRRIGTFFYFSMKLDDIAELKNFHNRLWLGNFIHRLKIPKRRPKSENKMITNYKDSSILMRFNDLGMLSVSVVQKSKQYEVINRIKQTLAYYLVRLNKKIFRQKKKVNLYFEKDCSRAEESAIRVFESVMLEKNLNSENYFILDEKSPDFQKLKEKYPNHLIRRFTFKHYYLLFSSTHLISSELSNHVVEVRVLNQRISKKIKSTPLYFLQHGIMFAKPVENPMAQGFYKKNMTFTLKKSVISSSLEAEEFYKMGYKDSELMKTGLATFDYAIRNKNADKIVYMPTYRYWEEKAIINGRLKETSYFFSILEVIKTFEKADLLDYLLITPHNKLSEYIVEYMPEYQSIICSNPSDALKQGCIFISDYSSAIYDAIYRGAYPIFYWKDEDYLIQNYGATPPVNKENAPGVIAYDEEELITKVKEAINKNYVIEDENLKKYRKINEFYDNKNTQRIIQILLEDEVI